MKKIKNFSKELVVKIQTKELMRFYRGFGKNRIMSFAEKISIGKTELTKQKLRHDQNSQEELNRKKGGVSSIIG